jgi:hypothetical protein
MHCYKYFKSYFSTFFLFKLKQSDPKLGFYSEKAKKCSTYIFKIRSKKVFCTHITYFKSIKTKKF